MPALPFRNRPILTHIVEQHAEEAAFLWTLRDAATDAPHYKRHHLARLDERVEAHVDGLRVAGEAGWRIALEQLERRCGTGEFFTASVLALERSDLARIEPLVDQAAADAEARRGLVGAIAWCAPDRIGSLVGIWRASPVGFRRYLAMCAYSVHRVVTAPGLDRCLDDEDDMVRARALRLAGELRKLEYLDRCLIHMSDASQAVRVWASWAAVLLGDRGAAMDSLETFAAADGTRRHTALETLTRAASMPRGTDIVRSLNRNPATRRLAVEAAGHFGNAAAVPWLIELTLEPQLARAAGESLSMITGLDLAMEDLERDVAPDHGGIPDPEDAPDLAGSLDADANLPWPNTEGLRAWWRRSADRFAGVERHLLGRPIDDVACRNAWNDGTQRQRRAAAYELVLSTQTSTSKVFCNHAAPS